MKGARFVHANESGQGHRLDEAVIKQLTGDATITCRFLYGRHFTYSPTFKIFLLSNNRPAIRDLSTGMLAPGPHGAFPLSVHGKGKDR